MRWLVAFLALLTGCTQSTQPPTPQLTSAPSMKVSTADALMTPALRSSVHVLPPPGTNHLPVATNIVVAWNNSRGVTVVEVAPDARGPWREYARLTNAGTVNYLRYVVNVPAPCFVRVANQ